MDRLKALEVFKAVAEKGNFVKAADALDLSPAVVSRAVQDLEQMLGLRLLQRTTRRVSLTPEGADVLERARSVLASFEDLTGMSRSAADVAGDIRFTVPASFASWLVPALTEFNVMYPKARVQLLATDVPLDLVEQRIDLALRITRAMPPSLIARRVGDVRVGVYAATAYLARRGTPKHPNALAEHDCLVHSCNGRDTTWPFLHPVTQQRFEAPVRGSLTANNADALATAAARGSGLALLPHFVVRRAVARGELQPVLTQWPTPPVGMFLAYTSRRHQPPRVRKLIDHIIAALAEMLENDDAGTPWAGPLLETSRQVAVDTR